MYWNKKIDKKQVKHLYIYDKNTKNIKINSAKFIIICYDNYVIKIFIPQIHDKYGDVKYYITKTL